MWPNHKLFFSSLLCNFQGLTVFHERKNIIFISFLALRLIETQEKSVCVCVCVFSEFDVIPLKWKWDLFSAKLQRAFALWHLRIYQMRFSIDPRGRDECPERINEPPL